MTYVDLEIFSGWLLISFCVFAVLAVTTPVLRVVSEKLHSRRVKKIVDRVLLSRRVKYDKLSDAGDSPFGTVVFGRTRSEELP